MSETKQVTTPKKTPTKSQGGGSSKKTTPVKTPTKSPSKSQSKPTTANKDSKDNPNHLPLARIRTIMKSAPDADMISQEALVLVCRAAEMFIQHMTKESHKKSKKPSFLEYKDLAAVVADDEKLEFLASIIPKKITVKEYKARLAEESSSEEGSCEDSDESESESGSEEESEEESEAEGDTEDKNGVIELSSDEEKDKKDKEA